MTEQDTRNWSMLCHLAAVLGFWVAFGNVLGPLVVWLIKRNDSKEVERHGLESMNFQLSVAIYLTIAFLLIFVGIGFVLYPVIAILALIFTIQAGIKASRGEFYKYPFTIRFFQ